MRHLPPDCVRRLLGLAPALLLVFLAGGCVAALGAGTVAAVAATDKTPLDHAYSLVTGKDCSLVRRQRGQAYCAEDEVVVEQAVHCYPTLGESTCYRTADPFPGGQREIGAPARLDGGGAGGQTVRTPSKIN